VVIVGSFGPGNSYSGRSVMYDAGAFTIEGLGLTDLAALWQSEANGQFFWVSAEMRTWAESLDGGCSRAQPATSYAQVGSASAAAAIPVQQTAASGPTPRTVWTITACVLLLAFVVGGVFIATRPAPGPVPDTNREKVVVDGGGGGGGDLTNGGGGTGTDVVLPPTYTEQAEIMMSMATINLPYMGPYGTMNNFITEGQFYAMSGDTAVGKRTSKFRITSSDLDGASLRKTKERSALVNGLVKQLENDGWTVTGQGSDWFAIQLSR
jgi:hypothetical protein